jgi:hypothetical protein
MNQPDKNHSTYDSLENENPHCSDNPSEHLSVDEVPVLFKKSNFQVIYSYET